jgi:hypothetical protein
MEQSPCSLETRKRPSTPSMPKPHRLRAPRRCLSARKEIGMARDGESACKIVWILVVAGLKEYAVQAG